MSARLDAKIEDFRAQCKAALWAGNKDLALLFVSIICGFRILLRMEKSPEACAYPPPSFNLHS